ncbi:MAG: lysozyme inhibitor LprI family protein [Terracidiphilus sp.]|jgi:uncharacterized protein YecT (DUF1311 family)
MMSTRDRASQITQIKERSAGQHGLLSYTLEGLNHQWVSKGQKDGAVPDFYIIKAVTILEVFTRRQIATLIDHARTYTDRAVELSKQIKMDFATVREVQGRAITLGDIVAHSVPVNSFSQIMGYFEAILGKPFRPMLEQAVDRWRVEIERQNPEPIIADFDALANHISRLFELRNILCHELPEDPVFSPAEVDELLADAARFAKATEAVLHFEKHGLTPLTQTETNIDAMKRLREKEEELNLLLSEIRTKVINDDKEAASLNEAQEKWVSYRNAHCDFLTWLHQGGTIGTFLWAGSAQSMTMTRIAEIESWMKYRPRP